MGRKDGGEGRNDLSERDNGITLPCASVYRTQMDVVTCAGS